MSEESEKQDEPADDEVEEPLGEDSKPEDIRDRLREARKSDGRIPSDPPPSGHGVRPVAFKTLDQIAGLEKNLSILDSVSRSSAFKLAFEPSPLTEMSSPISRALASAALPDSSLQPSILRGLNLAKQNEELAGGFLTSSGLQDYNRTLSGLSRAIGRQSALQGLGDSLLGQYSSVFSALSEELEYRAFGRSGVLSALKTPAIAGLPGGFSAIPAYPSWNQDLVNTGLGVLRKLAEQARFQDLLDFEAVPDDDDPVWLPSEFWKTGADYFEQAIDAALRSGDVLAGPEEAMRVSMAYLYFKRLSLKEAAKELHRVGVYVASYGIAPLAALAAFVDDPQAWTFFWFYVTLISIIDAEPGTIETSDKGSPEEGES